jgi:RHS repeat-associated protein
MANGSWVDYSDEVNRHAQRISDALGRLTAVMEPVANIPTLETDYGYDALGNLLTVNQKGTSGETPRTRRFTYDSLSRLLTASNPESGTICYGTWSGGFPGFGTCQNGYDAVGNLVVKTGAGGIPTSYSYDALNRLTQKSYEDGGASTVFYGYDVSSIDFVPPSGSANPRVTATLSNAIGRLAFASTSGSSLYAYSYDPLGRVKNQWLSTPSYNTGSSPVFQLNAVYDLAGDVTSLTYPNGRTVGQTWDGGGHLSQAVDGNGYSYLTTSTSYLANGAPGVLWYGNGVGNGFDMNNRQRINEMGISRVGSKAPGDYSGNNNLSVKEYCYGPSTSSLSPTIPGCPSLGVTDNGSIWQVTDTLNGGHTQNFSYDSLNRITSFARSDGTMQQTYAYDSFGNLNQTEPGTLMTNLVFDAGNRISSGGYGYDVSGNIISIYNGISTIPYRYDAENRLVDVNNGLATYTYDANGNRVRKDTSPNWTEYVNFNGQTLAEQNSDGTWSDYIFADGRRIARADNYDVRIHMSGTNCSGCNSTNTFAGTTSLGGAVSGTVIQNGDLLTWRQYQDGVAAGGVEISFTFNNEGTSGVLVAADGQKADADTRTGQWYLRVADLSAYQGLTVGGLNLYNYQGGAAGNWDIYLADISLLHPDGTVVPIYSRSLGSLSQFTPGAAESNVSVITEKVADTNPLTTVTHYSGDQVGSTVVLTDYAGWPVSSDTYYPFGQEPSPPADNNHYKFTGKERDSESGLDYFGARYLGSTMGRFMSPDDFGGHLDDPQTLNKYSYVANNPLSRTDPTGHDFTLGCSASDSALNCQRNNDTGQYEQGSYVKGADGKLSFQATDVHNDSVTGGLVDQQGNSYKGFVDSSGVFFQRNGSSDLSPGQWISGSKDTTFTQNGGALDGFGFKFFQPDINQSTKGQFYFGGAVQQEEKQLRSAGFYLSEFDQKYNGLHGPGVDHFRGTSDSIYDTAHFIVEQSGGGGNFHTGEVDPNHDILAHGVRDVVPNIIRNWLVPH